MGMHWSVAAATLGLLLGGCGSADQESPRADEVEEVGEATLALTTVPTGVLCIRVVAAGATTVSQDFTVAAGASSVLNLGRLPLGNVNITANAYNVACASIGSSLASWVSDPFSITLRAGVVPKVTLNLRQNNPVSADVNFIGNVVSIAKGYAYTLFVMSDGTVRYTGFPPGSVGGMYVPTAYPGLTNVVEATAGAWHACVRLGDGTARCWGSNTYGATGNGTVGGFVDTPTTVTALTGVTQIVAGDDHTCAMASGGWDVYCWGRGGSGQLGIGGTANVGVPTKLTAVFSMDRLYAGGASTCAIEGAGLFCWGANASGQLGDGTTTNRPSPVYVSPNSPYVSMGLGTSHACGVRADGLLRCWGANWNGQIGDGTNTNRLTPVNVPGITDATQVATSSDNTCVRRASGSVSCWGRGTFGTNADGTADDRTSPVTVAGLTGVASLYAAKGANSMAALLDNQSIFAWGQNGNAEIGDGTRIDRFKQVPVLMQ